METLLDAKNIFFELAIVLNSREITEENKGNMVALLLKKGIINLYQIPSIIQYISKVFWRKKLS